MTQKSHESLPKSYDELTDKLEFKFHLSVPSQTPCLSPPELSSQGMCLTGPPSLCPRTGLISVLLAFEGSLSVDSDPIPWTGQDGHLLAFY